VVQDRTGNDEADAEEILQGRVHGSQREDPADGQCEGQEVSSGPGSGRSQDDGAGELDGADGRQPQPIDLPGRTESSSRPGPR
jgi:hypothetical protein